MVRDTGCKGRIKRIEIQRQIDRSVEPQLADVEAMTHLVNLDAETFGLRPLVGIQCAYADLHQPGDLAAFHQPREGRCVAERVATHIVIQVRMRIDMKQVQP